MKFMCNNCGIRSSFKEIGYDDVNNLILECQQCEAVAYEDGSLVEGEEVKIINK